MCGRSTPSCCVCLPIVADLRRSKDLFLNEIGNPLEFTPNGVAEEWIQKLSESLEGPGDYALLAWTPSPIAE